MRNLIRTIVTSLAVCAISLGLFAAPAAAQGTTGGSTGQAKTDVCAGINLGGGTCNDNGTGISNVLKLVANILSIVAGVAAVIMIILAGLRYVTSGGDSSQVAGAKTSIIYAIVGLIIVALAQGLVHFVLSNAK